MNDQLARNAVELNKSENVKKNLESKLQKYEDRIRHLEGEQGRQVRTAKHASLMQT